LNFMLNDGLFSHKSILLFICNRLLQSHPAPVILIVTRYSWFGARAKYLSLF
jgi:hypothetical protein